MPIEDYTFKNLPRPDERLLEGIQAGAGIQNISNQRDAAIAEQKRQQALNESVASLNEIERPTADDYNKVTALLPKEQADSLRANWELKSKEYQSELLRSAGQTLAAFEADPKIGMKLLRERAVADRNSGNIEDAEFLDRLVGVAEIDPSVAKQTLGIMISSMPGGVKMMDSIRKSQGFGAGGGQDKSYAPITLVNPKTKEKILVTPVYDPKTKKARLEKASIPEGFEISRETKEEERAADIATVGAKKGAEVTGKAIATRRQKAVDQGFESSDQLPSLRRALTLLDTVKTGGISAVALKAKQAFGVEGADEAELSNALGAAILKQLKPMFGAAFTVEEGKGLERISAGFGKSPEGNRRIIKQLIQKIERKAKEGIKAAVASEDFEAAQRIKDNMTFSLDSEPAAQPVAALPQGVTEDDIAETMRANQMTREQVLARLGGQ